MEDFQAMQAFARVADLGSFTRAADELGLSRAMVSTHVQRLERRFGLRLLNRTTRKVALTPPAPITSSIAGAYSPSSPPRKRHCGGQGTADRSRARGRRRGPSAGTSCCRRSRSSCARYPGIDLDLRFNERVVDLVREGVDLAVRAAPVDGPGSGRAPGSGSRWITCASPAYLARHGRPQTLAELADHVLIGSIRRAARIRAPGCLRTTSRRPSSCGSA